eukprot:11156708-Lingulodinium_polyedra.AAC.1
MRQPGANGPQPLSTGTASLALLIAAAGLPLTGASRQRASQLPPLLQYCQFPCSFCTRRQGPCKFRTFQLG